MNHASSVTIIIIHQFPIIQILNAGPSHREVGLVSLGPTFEDPGKARRHLHEPWYISALAKASLNPKIFRGKLSPRNGSFRATFRFFFLGTFRIKRQWEMQQTCSQSNTKTCKFETKENLSKGSGLLTFSFGALGIDTSRCRLSKSISEAKTGS